MTLTALFIVLAASLDGISMVVSLIAVLLPTVEVSQGDLIWSWAFSSPCGGDGADYAARL